MNSNTNSQYQLRSQLWLNKNEIGGGGKDVAVDDDGNDDLSSNDLRSSPDDVFSKFLL
jgi:hypothetical protein